MEKVDDLTGCDPLPFGPIFSDKVAYFLLDLFCRRNASVFCSTIPSLTRYECLIICFFFKVLLHDLSECS